MVVEYIFPATILASSIAMLVSAYRIASLSSDKSVKPSAPSTSYRSLVAELEIRREAIKKAIISVLKQAEEGKITEEMKNALIKKFEADLENIERELKSLRLYAELESLREEYTRLLQEYEERKRRLEERIRDLEARLKVEPMKKKVVEEEKSEEKEEKRRKKKDEDDLEELYNEISKIIQEYGVE